MKSPIYSRDDIASMLFADSQARKNRDWTLVPSNDIIALNKELILNAGNYSQLFDTNQLLWIDNPYKSLNPLQPPLKPFRKAFPFVDTILNAFPGKLIVAGGSVFKSYQSKEHRHNKRLEECDNDFFFINCTTEEVEQIIRFAIKLLKRPVDHIKHLVGKVKQDVIDGNREQHVLCIDRCQTTTTIYYATARDEQDDDDFDRLNSIAEYHWSEYGGKMQFIHRIYPSAASVIGAFDIGVCMGFYDSTDFYATPLGAWSIATQTIILDVSRRSTSFEHRIMKYVTRNRCGLLIVNGNTVEAYQALANNPKLAMRTCRMFSPVKGINTMSFHTHDDENNFYCNVIIRDCMSDYDGGEFHEYSIEESNAIFAAQGKLDYITWRSSTEKGVFDKPLIRYIMHPDLQEDSAIPNWMYLDALRRWFTSEQIAKLKAGPIYAPQCVPVNFELLEEYADALREKVDANIAAARQRAAQGITIITDNPGRQWTASRNPVVSDPRQYYHPLLLANRGPMIIGIPHEVYVLLRLAQMKSDSVWRWLPRDMLNYIMHTLAKLMADDGNRLFLSSKSV